MGRTEKSYVTSHSWWSSEDSKPYISIYFLNLYRSFEYLAVAILYFKNVTKIIIMNYYHQI